MQESELLMWQGLLHNLPPQQHSLGILVSSQTRTSILFILDSSTFWGLLLSLDNEEMVPKLTRWVRKSSSLGEREKSYSEVFQQKNM